MLTTVGGWHGSEVAARGTVEMVLGAVEEEWIA